MGDTILSSGQSDAAIVKIHGTENHNSLGKGLAMTTDCTPRYVKANPFEGGMQAVCEAARNIAQEHVNLTSRCRHDIFAALPIRGVKCFSIVTYDNLSAYQSMGPLCIVKIFNCHFCQSHFVRRRTIETLPTWARAVRHVEALVSNSILSSGAVLAPANAIFFITI